jgi:cysteine protease ATG4
MALIGKELGKEVGGWFGPSTASGALKTLADGFPPCGLAVSTAADGAIYKSDVFAASSMSDGDWIASGQKGSHEKKGRWGHKAVLILVGLRLGLDGVNPIYHDVIKVSRSTLW